MDFYTAIEDLYAEGESTSRHAGAAEVQRSRIDFERFLA
jgi:hypothetical protein